MTRQRPIPLLTILFAVLFAVLSAACSSLAAEDAVDPTPGAAVVERIVDGDTLRVRIGTRREAVRLIGIDTPESVKPGAPVECFAKEAAAHLRTLAPPGSRIRLERDVEARDRYGRLLAYVYQRPDDLFVNVALAREGFARVAAYPPNVAHNAAFAAAVAEARDAGRGLWARCPSGGRSPP